MKGTLTILPISSIDDSNRVREDFGQIGELANSIKTFGLLQPIVVMKKQNEEDYFTLIMGGRRTQAHRLLNLSAIEAIVWPYVEDPIEFKEMELEENIRRKDLTWQEELKARKAIDDLKKATYGEKISRNPEDPGWNTAKTAEYLDVDPSNLYKDFKLLEAMEKQPELAKLTSKSDALKELKKIEQKEKISRIAAILDAHTSQTPLQAIRQSVINSYCIGDFNIISQNLESCSVDAIEFDPPYCIEAMAYAIDTTEDERRNLYTPTSSIDVATAEGYKSFLSSAFSNIKRILKPDSWIICWTSYQWAWYIRDLAESLDMKVCNSPAFWVKPGSGKTTSPEYNLGSSCEMCWLIRKGNAKVRRMGRSNVFIFPEISGQSKSHPTERPIEMIQEVIDTLVPQGSLLVSPCAGSGNTILACSNLKISCLAFDISEAYLDSFKIKVNLALPGGYRSYGR